MGQGFVKFSLHCKSLCVCMFSFFIIIIIFRLWGVNCGSAAHWNGCWRLMYIKRPHVLFVGM